MYYNKEIYITMTGVQTFHCISYHICHSALLIYSFKSFNHYFLSRKAKGSLLLQQYYF